jgi:hypothetical protein
MLERPRDLARRGERADGDERCADLRRGEGRDQPLGPVGQQERDPITAPHAEREQRAGHVVDPRAQAA